MTKNINTKVKKIIKKTALVLSIIMLISVIAGCGSKKAEQDETISENNTKIVFTTGFTKNEIFRIGKSSCSLSEVMLYLTNIQNQYEAIYGSEIWTKNMGGSKTLEDKVKDTVIARIAQIKTMNLLAEKYDIALTEGEEKKVNQAADTYFSSLNQAEKAALSVDKESIRKLYLEYALANKIYYTIIEDVNPEISDDEARTITVKLIFLKTYSMDGKKNKIEFTEKNKEFVLQKAQEILQMAQGGEDFDTLISKYSEDENAAYSFGKGEMDQNFEDAAFNLSTDEISNVVETQNGYYIIKCISTFDRKETDINKVKIAEQRKKEAFNQVYDDFVKSQVRNLNTELWDEVTFIYDEDIKTMNFFQVFSDTFEGVFSE